MKDFAEGALLSSALLAAFSPQPADAETTQASLACSLDVSEAIAQARSEKMDTFYDVRRELSKLLSEFPEQNARYSEILEHSRIKIHLSYAGVRKCGTVLPNDFLGYFKVADGKLNIIFNEDCFNQQLVLIKCIPELNENPEKNLARAWLPVLFHELEHARHELNIIKLHGTNKHRVPMEEEVCACIISASCAFEMRSEMIYRNCCKEELAFFDKSNYWLWDIRKSLLAGEIAAANGVVHSYYSQFNLMPITCPKLQAYYQEELKQANNIFKASRDSIGAQPSPSNWASLLDSRIPIP